MRFGEADAANGWEELCRQAPGDTRDAFELMRSGLIRSRLLVVVARGLGSAAARSGPAGSEVTW